MSWRILKFDQLFVFHNISFMKAPVREDMRLSFYIGIAGCTSGSGPGTKR